MWHYLKIINYSVYLDIFILVYILSVCCAHLETNQLPKLFIFFFHGWIQYIVFQAYHINNIHNGKFLLKIWATHSGFSQSELRYLDKCSFVVRAGCLRTQVSLHQIILWVFKQVLFYVQANSIVFLFFLIWSTLTAPLGIKLMLVLRICELGVTSRCFCERGWDNQWLLASFKLL